ncbi:MAG: putative toxin-antitoxin system toxin component, PIN family [Caldilineaceae bacterium]
MNVQLGIQSKMRVVLDTNVLFEGLTKQGSAAGVIMDAWIYSLFRVCVTDALIYEYSDVLSRKLSPARLVEANQTLSVLLSMTEFVAIHYRWRPSSPDPGDEFLIDCAMNANALLVTSNVRDFRQAQQLLGLNVFTPKRFLEFLI